MPEWQSELSKALVDSHAALKTTVHGVAALYLAKTSRSDQLTVWAEIYGKPATFPPAAHDANLITSGVLAEARIPLLTEAKIPHTLASMLTVGGGLIFEKRTTDRIDQAAVFYRTDLNKFRFGDGATAHDFPGITKLSELTIDVAKDWLTYEIKNFKVDVVNSLPAAGNAGRIVYLTTDSHFYLDDGSNFLKLLLEDDCPGPWTKSATSYNLPNDIAENTMLTISNSTLKHFYFILGMGTGSLAQNITVRMKTMPDGTNYEPTKTLLWETTDPTAFPIEIRTDTDLRITLQSAVAQGSIKTIYYRRFEQTLE